MKIDVKKLAVFLVILFLAHKAAAFSETAAKDKDAKTRPMQIEDVLALKSVQAIQINPDGRWIAYVVSENNFDKNLSDSDIWVVRSEGSEPVRLTYHVGRDNAPQWAPDGSWIAFLAKRGEKTQVYGIQPNGGEAWPVTHSKTAINSFRISPDGQHLAFVANSPKSKDQEEFEKERGRPIVWNEHYDDQWARLWVAPLKEKHAEEATRISPEDLHVTAAVWGPDSRQIAFAARPSPTLRTFRHGAVYVIGNGGGEPHQVTNMPGGESPVAWTQENGLIVSGTGKELGTFNRQLWQVPLSGGDPISLTGTLDEHAGFVAITEKSLLVEAAYHTGRRLYRISLKKAGPGTPETLSDDRMFYRGFSATKDGSKVAFLADTWNSSTDVYFSSTSKLRPKRLTDVNPQVSQFQLGEQRVVHWKSRADGAEIGGILTLPVGYNKGERAPLLLVIHGGPAGVSVDRFTASRGAYPVQVFAGQGYAILQPNYRGSTGYGERFRGLNRGDISGRDWIDNDSGVDEMVRQGIADPERLGIMGWSFGGHHTYWGITQTDRYKAASAGAGANDLISMYSQTDIPEFYQTYLGPKPWEDFQLYEQRSAYRFVTKVSTPLLIQVGEKDERVPAEQSIQFYEAVHAIGKAETKLVVYPGQPHGIREPRLRRDLMIRNLEWFNRFIPVAAATSEK